MHIEPTTSARALLPCNGPRRRCTASWATRSRPWRTAPRPWRARCSRVRGPGQHMLAHLRRRGCRGRAATGWSGRRAASHICSKLPPLPLRPAAAMRHARAPAACIGKARVGHASDATQEAGTEREALHAFCALCPWSWHLVQGSRAPSWCATACAWRACTSTRPSLRWRSTCWPPARQSPRRPLLRRRAGRQAPGGADGTSCA